MNKTISSLLLLILSVFAINAVEINVTPGNLAALMQSDKNITGLKITGSIDVRDFKFITDSLSALKELDLGRVTIEAFNDRVPYFGNKIIYEANTLPHLCMFGKEYTSLILPENLRSIDDGALGNCKKISAINFPSSLESIGEYAFYECEALETVVIPASVTNINRFAFSKCHKLKTLTINNGKALVIGDYAFSKCAELKDIKLSDNTKEIGAGAFSSCKNISSITFPEKIEYIKEEAFAETSIVDADLSNCSLLKSIGAWSFADNKYLESILLPENLESLGDGAFFYNTALHKVTLPSDMTRINDFLFSKCSAMDPNEILPSNTTEIGNYAFYNWNNLSKFYFPASITKIGNNAFEGCSKVSMFTINAITPPELGDNVFAGINQPVIPLVVPNASIDIYKNALQWKEFRVTNDAGVTVKTTENNSVKIFFLEKTLCVEAASDIMEIVMYDPSGTTLIKRNPNINSVRVETDNYAGRLYIISLLLHDNSRHNYKLIRE